MPTGPEIAQVELASLGLELAAWGSDDLRFVDAPPPGAFAAGRDLLRRLDALDAGGKLTARGRKMLALGVHPRLAAMLLATNQPQRVALACDIAALVEAPPHPLELRQRAADDVGLDAQLPAHGGRGEGIEHVVPARQVERHRLHRRVRQVQVEMHLRAHRAHVGGTHVGVGAVDAVGTGAAHGVCRQRWTG